MDFYNKYILPKYLKHIMGDKSLVKYRKQAVSKAFGTVLEIEFGSGFNLPFYKNINKLYALDPFLTNENLDKIKKENNTEDKK